MLTFGKVTDLATYQKLLKIDIYSPCIRLNIFDSAIESFFRYCRITAVDILISQWQHHYMDGFIIHNRRLASF